VAHLSVREQFTGQPWDRVGQNRPSTLWDIVPPLQEAPMSADRTDRESTDIATLLTAARAGEQHCWDEIVRRYRAAGRDQTVDGWLTRWLLDHAEAYDRPVIAIVAPATDNQ
jgi:hypothetical protein